MSHPKRWPGDSDRAAAGVAGAAQLRKRDVCYMQAEAQRWDSLAAQEDLVAQEGHVRAHNLRVPAAHNNTSRRL